MKHYKLTGNQLTATDGRFYWNEQRGAWVPSVTTVLDAYPKPYALLQWMKEVGAKADDVIIAAGKRGTSVHNMTEAYDRGEEVTLMNDAGHLNCSLEEWAMFERWVEFSRTVGPTWSEIERQYIGDEYAGTVDRVGYVPGVGHCLIDIKTSNGIWDTYWLQLAAYHQLVRSQRSADLHAIQAVGILWLNAKTRGPGRGGAIQGAGWQLVTLPVGPAVTEQMDTFRAVQHLWKAGKDFAKAPRETVYTIRHRKEG
jgi:hypothetical protein